MFNRSIESNKTPKGTGVQKNDTKPFSLWDIPLALVLLTRLPLPRLPEPVFRRQAQAAWAFPVAGAGSSEGLPVWLDGLAMVFHLSPLVAATLLVATLIMMTGAMHEDGLADTFDGLWGGFTPERRLEIMKDSQTGTYGVLALVISQLARVLAVAAILASGSIWTILAACACSRALMPVLMASLPNARKSGLSHSVGTPSTISVSMSLGLAVLIAVFLCGGMAITAIFSAALVSSHLGVDSAQENRWPDRGHTWGITTTGRARVSACHQRPDLGRAASFDPQCSTTMLAMHGIRIMPIQPAAWAFVTYFLRHKDRLRQTDKQRDTHDHDENREQLPPGGAQRDVTETSCGQGGHGEIQRVYVRRLCVFRNKEHQNRRRGGKDKNHQIDRCNHRVFMGAKKAAVASQVPEQMV